MLNCVLKKAERAAMLLATLALLSPTTAALAGTAPVTTVLTPDMYQNLKTPVSIALDPSGYFYVADPRAAGVSKFDLSGNLLQVFNLASPARAVALDNSGNVVVSQGTSVALLDSNGVQKLLLGSGNGQFGYATGIAVDMRGYIWVTDNLANKLSVFTAAGDLVSSFGTKGSAPGEFYLPVGVSYEKAADQVVVADAGNHRLQFFSATGVYSFVKSIGSFGNAPLQFTYPVASAFEYDGTGKLNRMYVADLQLSTIQVLDPAGTGTFLSYIGSSGLVSGLLMNPMSVAFDPADKRLIVVNGNGHLNLFGIDGGVNPVPVQGFGVDPVATGVKTPTVTITGSVPVGANVVLRTNTTALPDPVSYTSSSTWSSTVQNLAPGSNVVTVTAVNSSGTIIAKQSVGIIYSP
jgi:hypothetical protein